jgi:hypothetical protein
MGVTRIDSAKYFGYRAERHAGGEVRRKYFPLVAVSSDKRGRKASGAAEKRVRKQAEAYDSELATWQAQVQGERLRLAIPIWPSNNTGVRGITFRKRYREVKRGRSYHYPVFALCVLGKDGRTLTRRFRVYEGEERKAWKAAVDCLAEVKGLSARSLYQRYPAKLFKKK